MIEFIPTFYYLLAGMSLYAGFIHLLEGLHRPFERAQLIFAAASFSAFFLSFYHSQTLHPDSVEDYIFALKMSLFGALSAIFFIFWFVATVTHQIPRFLVIGFGVILSVVLIVNFIQPYSIQYTTITHLKTISFPWGEHILVAAGSISPGFAIASLISFSSFVYLFYIFLHYAAETGKRTDYAMLAALGLLLLSSAHGILTRMEIIPFIPLGPLAFLILIFAWSTALSFAKRQKLRLASIAYESTSDAIMITDENARIVATNHAFTALTGYSAKEALGQTPSLLSSGLQDRPFYQTLWKTLQEHGHWQGELWNRRKNGELFPEWLSISAVKDKAGNIQNYVGTFSDISSRKEAEETIHHLAFYDALTGLPNRRLFLDRLKQSLLSSNRRQHQGAILFIDLDDFKTVNDTRGHEIGDKLLIEIARRIQSCVHVDDTLARVGGDVFVVILEELNSSPEQAAIEAESIADRIHKAIAAPITLAGEEYFTKACIGISLFQDHETSMDEILKRADAAMFQAKDMGRNKIHFFDTGMQDALEARVLLEAWLRKAVPEQLSLFYQVQVDVHGNAIGAEALIRWQHPEKGIISPAAFIPLAEQSGLILSIGRWVLETACQQIKAWEQHPHAAHLVLSINVSAKEFQQTNFVDQVVDVIHRIGIDPSKLKLELTESLLAENIEGIINKMSALKSHGVLFSLDDFGTGFSSLAYLKKLPLDQLKIDQSFVRDINHDEHDAAIVRTIIALGQSLGLEVIAEGVETQAQNEQLESHGCFQYQGYLFSKPVPLVEFETLLLSKFASRKQALEQ